MSLRRMVWYILLLPYLRILICVYWNMLSEFRYECEINICYCMIFFNRTIIIFIIILLKNINKLYIYENKYISIINKLKIIFKILRYKI